MSEPSVLACATNDDPFLADFFGRRRMAVARLLPMLIPRLPRTQADSLATALADFDELPERAQEAVVSAPLFGYWWMRLSQLYRRGDIIGLTEWTDHLSRFMLPIQARTVSALAERRLPVCSDGVLRLPGAPWQVAVSEPHVYAAVVDGELELRTRSSQLDLTKVLPLVVLCNGTQLEPGDPWVQDYVGVANANARAEGGRGDARVSPPDEALAELDRATAAIYQGWPELGVEMRLLVNRIVPITSTDTVAFSNSALDGMLFIRTDLSNLVVATERLTHENSHLRLNAVFATHQIHHHAPEERLHSPYRKVPRPVDGLIHGAFVFARIAELHLRTHRFHQDERRRHRLAEVLEMQAEALDLIHTSVRLTPFGQRVYEEIRSTTEHIRKESVEA